MKKMKIFTPVFLFFIFTNLTAQKADYDSLISTGVKKIYQLKFDEAENVFQSFEREYPKRAAGPFFDAMILWWKIRLDMYDEQYDDEFYDKIENVLDFCDELLDENDEDSEALFFKGGALGFRGWLHSIRKEWFDAALDGKDALPLVYESYKQDTTNTDAYLGFGIYDYYTAVIPEKYPFVKPVMIFFPDGNKERGLKELEIAAEKGKYAKYEALFFLMISNYQFEENYDKSLEYADRMLAEFPDNPVFEKYKARSFVKKGDYKTAAEIFAEIYRKCSAGFTGYNNRIKREASYYVGNQFLRDGKLDSAYAYFRECELLSQIVDKEKETGFLISSEMMLAKILERQGKYDDAIAKLKMVLEQKEYKGSHKKAETRIKRMENNPKKNLKLLNDGKR
ncbi:MAG: hypothetical protein GXO87_09790 [Chlorobi bacterium]|nr:hypothetical protein [Chlorobiota bacterium]